MCVRARLFLSFAAFCLGGFLVIKAARGHVCSAHVLASPFFFLLFLLAPSVSFTKVARVLGFFLPLNPRT